MTSVDNGRQSVKSLFKMLEVLEAFSSTDPELSVVEIARRSGLPRTTVHRIVDSLRSVGFLEQEASRDRYRLGIKLFELGGSKSTLAKYNFDRHWRNARAHTLHDPVRWK